MSAVRVRPEAGTLAGGAAAAKSLIAFDRLLVLDDLWTGFVRSLDPEDRAEIESHLDELGELVDDMDQALRDAIEQAGELRMFLNSAEDQDIDIDSKLADLRPDLAEALESMFSAEDIDVGLRGAAIFACNYLAEEGEDERGNLRQKYESLKAGGPPDSDLRPCFRCALHLAKLGAGAAAAISVLIATQGSIVAVLPVLPGVVNPAADAILRWRELGCTECWNTITRGRFA
jgi:hypothetical protein